MLFVRGVYLVPVMSAADALDKLRVFAERNAGLANAGAHFTEAKLVRKRVETRARCAAAACVVASRCGP